ncbi:nucleotide exchange factor GrpE [bacterium]|nr:MAG: nucleotide exchange factor GrpE [bacterium]
MSEKKQKEQTLDNQTIVNEDLDTAEISATQHQPETDASQAEVQTGEVNLLAEIEKLKEEVNQKNDLLLRKSAEFENMRKRVERERYMTIQLSKVEALNDFLPINDDLLRTLDSSKNLSIDENFLKGVQLVAEKFENVLLKNGIEKINEIHVPFDVNLHEALMKQPSPNADIPSGTVLQVFEPGYKMGERVVRHAKVIVSE